jgi:glycosyltransferase involved in cell wall biosynthesis
LRDGGYDDVRYVPLEQNRGENGAREAGLDVATGQCVQFLDDDDLLRADKIRLQKECLDEGVGVVYSGLQYYERGEVIRPDPDVKGDVLDRTLQFAMWPPCFTSTMLIDRTILDQIRPLEHHGAGDTTFMIGLARRTQFDFVDAPLVEKRLEVDNLGFSLENVRNKKQLLSEYESLYDQFPECRKRAKSHVYRQEGHVRLAERPWSARAIVAFARATYHTPTDRTDHLAAFLGSFGGQPGIQTMELAGQFVNSCRENGPTHTLRKAIQYFR